IPFSLLIYLVLLLILRFVVGGDATRFGSAARQYVLEEKGKLGPMKLEEKLTLGVFLVVLLTWLLPGIASNLLPQISRYLQGLGYAVPALVGVVLLCTIRVKNQPLVGFRDWMANMEWSAIMLVAAIMVIGDSLGKPDTGIPQLLAGVIEPIANGAPFYGFLLVGIFWAGLQASFMSHLVSSMLVYTVMMPAAIDAGVGNLPALGYAIFAMPNYAFILPSATVVTAIIAGSGWVPVKFMARYGAIALIPMILLVVFIAYPLASLVLR
ncbi:MAG: anion permease, partial [Dehalococcoidales bacterium]|nr:anion permease [Dehalococcoidales bacterium]